MSGAAHTKGPWQTRAGSTTGVEVVGKKPRGGDYVVARCGGSDREANGSLIAAAPDLLAALRGLLLQHDNVSDESIWRQMREYGSAIDAARAALSKAEGLSAGVEDGR